MAIATIKVYYEELGDDEPVVEARIGAASEEGRTLAIQLVIELLAKIAGRTVIHDEDTGETLFDSAAQGEEIIH